MDEQRIRWWVSIDMLVIILTLERFPAKWIPVRVKKTR
jgi:hypothetical protein